ncbi:MAG TPA: asparaginase [Candidatus Marinimicrobia bacterium]|nr:asparaginase [Candidatus Neomarinimicrobiota bacterium]
MPILCRVTRGELTESIHVAFAVAVDETRQPFYSTGDPQYLTCIRSSLKPFQAAASVKAGAVDAAEFNDEELALMCASHKGEMIHVKTAQSMLTKLGLTVDDYECGSHFPSDTLTRHRMIREDKEAQPLHNNCSGKHAGMLALAKHLGQGTANYIKKDHPVQRTILEYVQDVSGLEMIPTEIDGCSAPTPFMTLETIAGMFQTLAAGNEPELKRVFKAMCSCPDLVGGSNHFDTNFIKALTGRGVTKVGGESVRGIALKTKDKGPVGIAIKILDGNFRALPVATMKLLEHLELLTEEELQNLDKFRTKILKNHNQIEIGRIEAHVEF